MDTLAKNFHNLVKGYKKAVERKYKQISLEISRIVLLENHDLLLNSKVDCNGDANELVNQVET